MTGLKNVYEDIEVVLGVTFPDTKLGNRKQLGEALLA